MFDTLKYNKKLIAAGQSPEAADVFTEAMTEMAESNFMTKADLQDLKLEFYEFKAEVRAEFKNVHNEFKIVHNEFGNIYKEFDHVRKEMHSGFQAVDLKLERLKKDMVIHTGAIQVASVALIVSLIKFL